MTISKLQTTLKANKIKLSNTDQETADIIGISKPTLYTRLKKHNWKKGEVQLINMYIDKEFYKKIDYNYYCKVCKKKTFELSENGIGTVKGLCTNCKTESVW